MGRRALLVTQDDLNRAVRAAKAAGAGWTVEIEPRRGVIRIVNQPSKGDEDSGDCVQPELEDDAGPNL